jgi:hypothetical protein
VNAQPKIAIEPLEFDEFATLDAVVGAEIAERVYHNRFDDAIGPLRRLRARLDRARPSVGATTVPRPL